MLNETSNARLGAAHCVLSHHVGQNALRVFSCWGDVPAFEACSLRQVARSAPKRQIDAQEGAPA